MALPTRYGSSFLAGTKGQTFAAGYDIGDSGVVDGGTIVKLVIKNRIAQLLTT